jgi:DMSO/TMAO reductase YedYZ molybdopterin-dependent catalytic subunit
MSPGPRPKKYAPSERTLSRRDLLSWLGKGSVLALSSPLLQACAGGGLIPGLPWFGDVADGFEFKPGPRDDEVFDRWWERTVDRQDVQQILDRWQLRVDGMVGESRSYSFADMIALQRQDQVTDFHCVEGWSVHDVPWNGMHIATLLEQVGVESGATHITFHTIGGRYNESLPLDVAMEPKTLLGYGVAGNTLPLEHGFPLRLVVPRLYGYKSAKYVERIELTDQPVEGYWVEAGYPYGGEVAESRLREGKY